MPTDSFTYTVADDWGQRTASVTVTIEGGTVLFVNANDDAATTLPGTAVVVPVLTNDNASASLLPLEIEPGSVTNPSPSGAAVITTSNQIRYTPAPGASGIEATFSYRAKPQSAATPTSTATVRVQVQSTPGTSPFVKVFPFRIASAGQGDIIRPSFSPLAINSYNIPAGKVLDLRGFRGKHHDPSQGPTATFRIVGGANSCVTGGTTTTDNTTYLAMTWGEAHGHPQWDNAPGLRVDNASGDMSVEGFDLRGSMDALLPDSGIGAGIRVTFSGIHVVDCKDDGIQNDNSRTITVQNAFIQSHVAFSERPSSSSSPLVGQITTVRNCLIWQKRQRYDGDEKWHNGDYTTGGSSPGHPQSRKVERWFTPTNQNNQNISDPKSPDGWAHKWFLKPDGIATAGYFRTRFDMRHVLIRMDTIPIEGTSVVFPPLGDGIGAASVRGSYYENVVVLWMQGGSWPFPAVPSGVTVITNTDQAYELWQREQAAWYQANGYDPATETFSWTRRT